MWAGVVGGVVKLVADTSNHYIRKPTVNKSSASAHAQRSHLLVPLSFGTPSAAGVSSTKASVSTSKEACQGHGSLPGALTKGSPPLPAGRRTPL